MGCIKGKNSITITINLIYRNLLIALIYQHKKKIILFASMTRHNSCRVKGIGVFKSKATNKREHDNKNVVYEVCDFPTPESLMLCNLFFINRVFTIKTTNNVNASV